MDNSRQVQKEASTLGRSQPSVRATSQLPPSGAHATSTSPRLLDTLRPPRLMLPSPVQVYAQHPCRTEGFTISRSAAAAAAAYVKPLESVYDDEVLANYREAPAGSDESAGLPPQEAPSRRTGHPPSVSWTDVPKAKVQQASLKTERIGGLARALGAVRKSSSSSQVEKNDTTDHINKPLAEVCIHDGKRVRVRRRSMSADGHMQQHAEKVAAERIVPSIKEPGHLAPTRLRASSVDADISAQVESPTDIRPHQSDPTTSQVQAPVTVAPREASEMLNAGNAEAAPGSNELVDRAQSANSPRSLSQLAAYVRWSKHYQQDEAIHPTHDTVDASQPYDRPAGALRSQLRVR
eukprot:jgi/Chlat1/4987/Chrsp32S04931